MPTVTVESEFLCCVPTSWKNQDAVHVSPRALSGCAVDNVVALGFQTCTCGASLGPRGSLVLSDAESEMATGTSVLGGWP
ncbi:hypothetical protein LINGRAHAP2_LOCUS17919, partial [Linum grandiflorum]